MAEIIVVLGSPGSGKSTHAERLCSSGVIDKPVLHVSAGNRLRGIRAGLVASKYAHLLNSEAEQLTRPRMIDHGIVNRIVFEFVSSCPSCSVVLVDGYPRYVEAVCHFLTSLEEEQHKLSGCINLDLSPATCLARLRGRGTRTGEKLVDNEFVKSRFEEYIFHTRRSVLHLKGVAPVIDIDAELPLDEVWGQFAVAFKRLLLPGNAQER